MYATGRGVPQDYVQAHMWFNLAASRLTGDRRETGVENRDRAARQMTPAQIADAQRLARAWAAAHPFERGPMILAAPPRPREPYALSSSVGG